MVVAGAIPVAEVDRLNLHELQRRLGLINRDGQQLVFAERISRFRAHPVRFDRVFGPDHDHYPGLGDSLLDLGIKSVAVLNRLAVQPDRQSGLGEHVRQRVGSVRVVPAVADE